LPNFKSPRSDGTCFENDPVYLPKQAGEIIGSSPATLQKWRSEGGGTVFVKLGRRKVGYRASALQEWLAARTATSTADARARGLSSSINGREERSRAMEVG
jgi:predicted DNA-binding transcriptional regulator AlpA